MFLTGRLASRISQIPNTKACCSEEKGIHFEKRGLPKWPQVSALACVDRIIKRSDGERYCQRHKACVSVNARSLLMRGNCHLLTSEDAFPVQGIVNLS